MAVLHKSLRVFGCVAFLGFCAGSMGCQEPAYGYATTLAEDGHGVRSIAVADGYVYWSTDLSGQIKRIFIDGGSVEVLVEDKQQHPDHLSMDADHVYWTTGDNNVMRVLRDGGEPELVINVPTNLTGLAVDSEFVYWTRTTGELEGLAIADIVPQALPPSPQSFLGGLSNPRGVVATSALYFVEGPAKADGLVNQWFVGADAIEPVVGSEGASLVTADPQRVVWGGREPEQIQKVSWAKTEGSAVTTVESGRIEFLHALALDKDNVYWTSLDGSLSTVSLDGGLPQDVVLGPEGAVSLALDRTAVFWANSSSGEIRTMPKAVAAQPLE